MKSGTISLTGLKINSKWEKWSKNFKNNNLHLNVFFLKKILWSFYQTTIQELFTTEVNHYTMGKYKISYIMEKGLFFMQMQAYTKEISLKGKWMVRLSSTTIKKQF